MESRLYEHRRTAAQKAEAKTAVCADRKAEGAAGQLSKAPLGIPSWAKVRQAEATRRGRCRHNAGEILDTLFSLMRKAQLSPGYKTRYMVCEALLDRGFGRAPHTLAAAIQHHTGLDGTALHLEGAAMSPLLQAAHAYAADEAKQLQPPDAVKAIDVTAEPISPQSSSQSSQRLPEVILMSPPAPAVEPAPRRGRGRPGPGEAVRAGSGGPKTKPPFSGIPADGAHYIVFKERARQEDEERRKQQEAARADPARYPGGQIPMNELQPDKVNIDQGPMEVLRTSAKITATICRFVD